MEIIEELYLIGADVYPNEPLSRHTSLMIGGKVRALIVPNGMESLLRTIRILRRKDQTFRIMGMGTNLLVSDDGLEDFVLKTERVSGVEIFGEVLIAEAGAPLKGVCEIAMMNALSGLEELYGIPGSIGGAVYMNAGAYGKEMKDVLEWVELFDGEEFVRLSPSELGMGYRWSGVGKRLVTRVALRLLRSSVDEVEEKMRYFLKRRLEKQPIFERSAGSLFKRPRPDFYVGSAIEKLGMKGFKIGGMKISEKHAGFMVNEGSGTFEDAVRLIREVRRRVKEAFGEELETEVVIWR